MYQIKQLPSDFIVNELARFMVEEEGDYIICNLKKINYNTITAIEHISKKLKIPIKNISFAGTKDKVAITSQFISIKGTSKEKIKKLELKDIVLDYLGKSDEPISLGEHEGNEFIITIRNLTEKDIKKIKTANLNQIPNYFGEQRFSKNNVEIGKAILKKDFKTATEILKKDSEQREQITAHLKNSPNDYVGALKKIPIKLLKIFLHSYQSYLWNESVKILLKENPKNREVPIVGFGTEPDKITKKIMEKENITKRDFIIKPFPQLSSEGDKRKIFMEVDDFNILTEEDDELNPKKKKITITFKLRKGQYATTLFQSLLSC